MKITHASAFIAGVAAAPLVLVGVEVLNDARADLVRKIRKGRSDALYLHDERARSLNAAAIMYAPKIAAVSLPGGFALAWRSKTPARADVIEFAERIRDIANEETR